MSIRIAKAAPFSGKPMILTPSVVGVSTGKEFIYRIPAIGERPIRFEVTGLPEGVRFGKGVLEGCVGCDGEWEVKITAENVRGQTERTVKLTAAPDNMLRTPLMGFTSWNAFAKDVTQADIEASARLLIESGLADYGYGYINLDSAWQKEYGGPFDAIQPNEKFPDMKGMYDTIHSLGLRGGIYSTPMLTAWGCPAEFPSIPGCTRGEPDPLMINTNGGIGVEHMEENNVRQWEAWGVDYLKYDWLRCDPTNADRMKQALLRSSREISLCITVNAIKEYGHYWTCNCASWRDNVDSLDEWDLVVQILNSADGWKPYVRPGHFFDLDMLEIGAMKWNDGVTRLTDAEALFAYSMRAFFASPIQLSCRLDRMSETEFDLFCNEEVIAINQDALADFPEAIRRDESLHIYRRRLENGDLAYALFNLEDCVRTEKLELPEGAVVRDVWAKETLPAENFACELEAHGAAIYRVKVP